MEIERRRPAILKFQNTIGCKNNLQEFSVRKEGKVKQSKGKEVGKERL